MDTFEQNHTAFRGCALEEKPFPLEEAEGRLERIRQRGASLVRLAVTWEALEREGPGIYDESYLAYLRKLINLAGEKGISAFIEPRQNRWSRWASGDGAPPWALDMLDADQEGLLERYLACMRHCFRRLKNCKALIGWGAAAADFSKPFMLRFAGRMREAKEDTVFFVEELPQDQAPRPVWTAKDPPWAATAFRRYDGAAFWDYREALI
jgi:hypothetical protein